MSVEGVKERGSVRGVKGRSQWEKLEDRVSGRRFRKESVEGVEGKSQWDGFKGVVSGRS